TRSYGDWSSDVCSSDLPRPWPDRERSDLPQLSALAALSPSRREHVRAVGDESLWEKALPDFLQGLYRKSLGYSLLRAQGRMGGRSEERRVGKEVGGGEW